MLAVGLDPMTQVSMSTLLWEISHNKGPQIVLALQDRDTVPKWITHLLYLGEDMRVRFQGPLNEVVKEARRDSLEIKLEEEPVASVKQRNGKKYRWDYPEEEFKAAQSQSNNDNSTPLVQMQGVQVKYGERTVLGDWEQPGKRKGLWWDVKPGDRWGVFGPNGMYYRGACTYLLKLTSMAGSGKTTLFSLINSDHPQTYSLPILLFGRSRLPTQSEPGISIFDIQARIGQASPEIHNFFPKNISLRQTIESAYADTFLSKPSLTYKADVAVDTCLRWFQKELNPAFASSKDPVDSLTSSWINYDNVKNKSKLSEKMDDYIHTDIDWADHISFRDLSFSAQRVALFLRAIVKKPDLVVLDEAFSGMDERTRIKCVMFLAYGEARWLIKQQNNKSRTFEGMMIRTRTAFDILERVSFTGLEPRQALISVSHRREEVPFLVDKWLCLPEAGKGAARFGTIDRTGSKTPDWWKQIWNSDIN